ncbi:phosphoribosylanthranilate isomerase [Lentisphaerota bacterium WC36G]|nr:phosphoribosylanthranilate isomerase [Lentisphaerae bacterium WC36]
MTKIKICGLTNLTDVIAAVQLKVDYLGFIFYSESPRFATPEFVAKANKVIPSNIKKVGVFVNAPKCVISIYEQQLNLDIVQLHGDKDCAMIKNLSSITWRALHLTNEFELQDAVNCSAEKIVVDSRTATEFGGTGQVCDWQIAKKLSEKRDILLAGGINENNVVEAINTVQPFGIDVSSGVESEPGKKDHQKMFNLVKKIRSLG